MVQSLIAAHLDPATRDFNLDQLRATAIEPETLASIVQTPPMMAEWRVVVVRDAQAFAATARTRALLESLVDRPMPGTAFILSAHLAERGMPKTFAQLQKKARSVVFRPLSANDLPGWLIDRAETRGVVLEPAAARALAATAGPELGRLAQEITKLCDFVGDRKRIESDDIRNLVGHIPTQNRWDWIDLVGDADFTTARLSLDTLLEDENGVGIVIGLGTQLIRIGIALNGGDNALAGLLPTNQQFLVQRIRRQARKWTRASLESALDDLLRADRLLKSASLDDRQVIEELLLRLQLRHAA
jgi:DNA polymerase-3 subunit delta